MSGIIVGILIVKEKLIYLGLMASLQIMIEERNLKQKLIKEIKLSLLSKKLYSKKKELSL